MAIQPGTGYTFTASSQGENLNIEKPWEAIGLLQGRKPLQFEVRAYGGVYQNTAAIQIAKGAVNFDKSNMPQIWKEPLTSRRQIFMQKVAVGGSGVTSHDGEIPIGQTPWMENGGYYQLSSDGFYYVTICKPDIDGAMIDVSALLTTNRPFVSIFKSSEGLYEKIFQETGPSQYVNRHNIQKMEGYDKDSTGLDYDFGSCHTTWFNPVKWGYDCKIIATIEVTTVSIGEETVKRLDIRQHVVGSIDINIPLQYLGSTLYDKAGETEEDDPFNVQNDEDFIKICNNDLKTTLNSISPLNTNFFVDMLSPDDWEETNFVFDQDCTGGTCKHPFYVKKYVEDDVLKFSVCVGSVNNVLLPDTDDLYTATADGFVYIRAEYDGTNYPSNPDGVSTLYATGTMPADTDEFGRIAICHITGVDDPATATFTQLVTGSLWSDRLKIGTATARYYFAQV